MAAIYCGLKYIPVCLLNGKYISVSSVSYRFWGWKTHIWYHNYNPMSYIGVKGHFKVIARLFQ